MAIKGRKCKMCVHAGGGNVCNHPESHTGKQCNCKEEKYTPRSCLNCGYYKEFGYTPVCGAWRGGKRLPKKSDQKNCGDWMPKGREPLHWIHQDESIEWRG
jgi:hypothetical protein